VGEQNAPHCAPKNKSAPMPIKAEGPSAISLRRREQLLRYGEIGVVTA